MWEYLLNLGYQPKGPMIFGTAKLVRKINALFDAVQGDLWFVFGKGDHFAGVDYGLEGHRLLTECLNDNFDARGRYRYRLPPFTRRRHDRICNDVISLLFRGKVWAIACFKLATCNAWKIISSYGLEDEDVYRELSGRMQQLAVRR